MLRVCWQCQEVFAFNIQSLSGDIKSIVDIAHQKLGTDFEAAKEAYTTLERAPQLLSTSLADCEQAIDKLKAAFVAEGTIEGMRKLLAKLKESKAEKARDQGAIRKAVALLKSLIKKRETTQLKGLRGESMDDTSQEAEAVSHWALISQHFANHICATHGPVVRASSVKPASEFDRQRPAYLANDELKGMRESIAFLPTIVDWLNGQLKDKETASAAFDKPRHYEVVRGVMEKSMPKDAFAKPQSVLHDCLQSIFCMSVQVFTPRYVPHGFLPYGLGSWYAPLQGALLLVGVQAQSVPGHSFVQKLDSLGKMQPDDMSNLVMDHGFCMRCEPGAAGWMPAGFLTVVLALAPTAIVRWSSLDPAVAPDSAELRAILSATTQMVSSYPSLAATYRDWLRYLEVATHAGA